MASNDMNYRVVFRGEMAQGKTADDVKNRLVDLIRKDYYSIHRRYTSSLTDLDFVIEDPKVFIEILNADENCFEAKGTTYQLRKDFWIDCNGNERRAEKVLIDSSK